MLRIFCVSVRNALADHSSKYAAQPRDRTRNLPRGRVRNDCTKFILLPFAAVLPLINGSSFALRNHSYKDGHLPIFPCN